MSEIQRKGWIRVDATSPITLTVAKDDAVNGSKDPLRCALARCVQRTIPGAWARIGRTRAYVFYPVMQAPGGKKHVLVRYMLSKEAQEAVRAFDITATIARKTGVGRPYFKPGDYELIVPTGYFALGYRAGKNTGGPGGKGGREWMPHLVGDVPTSKTKRGKRGNPEKAKAEVVYRRVMF